jgi:hypothetical protein
VESCRLIRSLVVASGAAGLTVHQAVLANADLKHGLAEAAVLIALALRFWHFALSATVLGAAGSSGHRNNVAPGVGRGNVPLVTSDQLLIADC